jgi:hypothetical protein
MVNAQIFNGRKVEVDRGELIATLEANKTAHIKQYNRAIAGYVATSKEALKQELNAAQELLRENARKIKESLNNFDPAVRRSDVVTLIQGVHVPMPVPKNFEENYNAALDMAMFDVNETLVLTFQEFQAFIRDEWEWSHAFETTTRAYLPG